MPSSVPETPLWALSENSTCPPPAQGGHADRAQEGPLRPPQVAQLSHRLRRQVLPPEAGRRGHVHQQPAAG